MLVLERGEEDGALLYHYVVATEWSLSSLAGGFTARRIIMLSGQLTVTARR